MVLCVAPTHISTHIDIYSGVWRMVLCVVRTAVWRRSPQLYRVWKLHGGDAGLIWWQHLASGSRQDFRSLRIRADRYYSTGTLFIYRHTHKTYRPVIYFLAHSSFIGTLILYRPVVYFLAHSSSVGTLFIYRHSHILSAIWREYTMIELVHAKLAHTYAAARQLLGMPRGLCYVDVLNV